MAIPFTQYVLPDGRRKSVSVERPAEIEALADKFIAAGGKYECEVLTTGHISLTAQIEVDGEPQDVGIEIVHENGPPVLAATDNLVRRSVTHIQAGA